MESHLSFDRTSPVPAAELASATGAGPVTEQAMQPDNLSRTAQANLSAALAAAQAASKVRFPGEDSGRSLVEMAQRDLDAALQLLTDRAQYITGSSGAAIALKRSGRNDMLCRATTGSNAPELGTLLSTEFGLSGESVRTRQPLRCDDAERDARVNREVCRQIGISSVVVMPVVHDDEVMGVFELFSGKANAFGERDVTALRRLSEMVETAVTLARAAEELPQRLGSPVEMPANADEILAAYDAELEEDSTLDVDREFGVEPRPTVAKVEGAGFPPSPTPLAQPEKAKAKAAAASADTSRQHHRPVAPRQPEISQSAPPLAPHEPPAQAPAKKPLLWSAAVNLSTSAEGGSADQSHIPPAFRSLRKCDACGFPVSAERSLCVECEEKKWRGQLKMPRPNPAQPVSVSTATGTTVVPRALTVPRPVETQLPASAQAVESKVFPASAAPLLPDVAAPGQVVPQSDSASPTLILSAGLEPSQSWLAKNKFILGALLVILGTAALILLVGHI